MSDKASLPQFTVIWGIVCTLTFFVQLLAEMSGLLQLEIFAFFSLNGQLIWQGNIMTIFAVLTILGVYITGLLRIRRDEVPTGVMFIIFGTGLTTVIGIFYISLNVATLLNAIINTIGSDPVPFEWTFTLYGSIITWIITLPAFSGIRYIKEVTKPQET